MQRSLRASFHIRNGLFSLGIIVLLTLVAATAPRPVAAGNYPKVLGVNLDPNPGAVTDLARYDHVAYNYRTLRTLRQSVRALNPSSIDFVWISSMSVSTGDSYGLNRAIRDSANAYNWWLYKEDGSHAISWCASGGSDIEWVLDLSDTCPRSPRGERFRDWFARTLVDSLVTSRQFHGICLDQCHSSIAWLRSMSCNPQGIRLDFNRDGIGDADSTVTRLWANGVYDFLRQLRQLVGTNYPVILNGAVNLVYDNDGKLLTDFANGVMMECFLFMPPTGQDWMKNLWNINRGYFPTQNRIVPYNGEKMMIIGDSGPCLQMTGPEAERQKRLTLGGCLLGDAYYTRPPWSTNEWQPEYDLCLGQPLAPCDSVMSGGVPIWTREFTNGYVAVNPNWWVSAVVPGRGVTLPPRDAIIYQYPMPRVTDLVSTLSLPNAVQVRFTVPGAPSGCGGPATYRLRSRDLLNQTREWTGPIIGQPGSAQYVNAVFLTAGMPYRFTVTVEKPGLSPSAASDTLRVTTPGGNDTQPPTQVQGFSTTSVTTNSVTLRWIAPSDPPLGGQAAAYEMRRWLDGGSWATGAVVAGLPSPAAPGTEQSVMIRSLATGVRYHFQIRSRDYNSNWSPLSYEVTAVTRRSPIGQAPVRPDLSLAVPNPFRNTTRLTLARRKVSSM